MEGLVRAESADLGLVQQGLPDLVAAPGADAKPRSGHNRIAQISREG